MFHAKFRSIMLLNTIMFKFHKLYFELWYFFVKVASITIDKSDGKSLHWLFFHKVFLECNKLRLWCLGWIIILFTKYF